MVTAVLMLLFGAVLVGAYVKVKNDRFQSIVDSDLDDDLDPELVDAALAPQGQEWDAAE
jgi:hypothetical protein